MGPTNEWSTLKRVIVGVADNAIIPEIDLSIRTVNYADVADIAQIPTGRYPQQVINEANEDLTQFAKFLTNEGVTVVRPDVTQCNYYNYCPRDSVFIHGDLTLATPMPLRAREDEYKAFRHHLSRVTTVDSDRPNSLYNSSCVSNPDVLALTEVEPSWDAANAIRANDDILYLVSNSGNMQGAKQLQSLLTSGERVHTLEGVYSYMHIDSTIAFLREGLMLLNPSRIKDISMLPEPFRSWDYIWCPEPTDIGHYPGYCNASNWINMNLFSVNPNLVALEENQHSLRKELEKYKIDCAMLPMRQQRTLGGGFHCVTLDLERHVE
jgi:N-dimethylarginine dimethylaminohydrolase